MRLAWGRARGCTAVWPQGLSIYSEGRQNAVQLTICTTLHNQYIIWFVFSERKSSCSFVLTRPFSDRGVIQLGTCAVFVWVEYFYLGSHFNINTALWDVTSSCVTSLHELSSSCHLSHLITQIFDNDDRCRWRCFQFPLPYLPYNTDLHSNKQPPSTIHHRLLYHHY